MTRRRTPFDDDWMVHVGELDLPPRSVVSKATTTNGFSNLTRGEKPTSAPTDFIELFGTNFQATVLRPDEVDSGWRSVQIPHDWRIEALQAKEFDGRPDYPYSWQGYFPPGVAYYRKTFTEDLPTGGERVSLTFDGVSTRSEFWLNGFWLGSHASGYSPVTFDVTELLRTPDEGLNVILVKADSTQAEGWWYEGGGIYRHVWLNRTPAVHVGADGIFVSTPVIHEDDAEVLIEVEIVNESDEPSDSRLDIVIRDPGGQVAASGSTALPLLNSLSRHAASLTLHVAQPSLWDIGQGTLYRAEVTLHDRSGNRVDAAAIDFGIRSIEWAAEGMYLNGRLQKIYGVNIHQDFGGLGIALPDRIIEAKLEMLAEGGVNAVRSAHHPSTPELVAHADRMGMLVLAENRQLTTSPEHLAMVASHVRRFRSSPSVMMWSLENEEMNLQGTRLGARLIGRIKTLITSLDPTRATTVGGLLNLDNVEYYDIVDVVGMHYQAVFGTLESALDALPHKPHIEDEEGLFASTRGVYLPNDQQRPTAFSAPAEGLSGGGDIPLPIGEIAQDIATTLHHVFTHDRLAGAFVWTGFDYLGEPVGAWPAVSSSYGGRDLMGLPKDYYWLMRALFRPEPLVHAFPHWTWPEQEQTLPFGVYTNCDEVEIRVNDRLIARQVVEGAAVRLKEGITFEAGKLDVIGFIAGVAVARHTQYSAGAPAGIVLSTDRSALARDGHDVAIVRAAIVDAHGRFVPTAATSLTFHVAGDAKVIGVGNGDPSSVAPQKSDSRETFNGYAAAIVQAGDSTGPIVVEASGIGVSGARLTFGSTDAPASACVHRPIDERENPLDPHEILSPEGMSGDGAEQQNLSRSSAVAPALRPA